MEIYFCRLALEYSAARYRSGSRAATSAAEHCRAGGAHRCYVPDERYRDDAFGLVVVKDAIVSLKACSGGGACLVDSTTKEVMERGRNRQYSAYFRSDMHAEMDLLNRYEDLVRSFAKQKG